MLRTRIRIPPRRDGLIAREHLVAIVRGGLALPVTVVMAPAGYGKTTLVAEAVRGLRDRSVAWLSCDPGDNAPGQFWNALLQAIDRAVPGLTGPASAQLQAVPPPSGPAVMAAVLNAIPDDASPLVVVLDDYHLIESADIHEALDVALAHPHPGLHLVLTTRADPPLALSRLRARGQVLDLGVEALRFQTDEAARFLHDTMGLDIGPEAVSVLETRTEGWAAGLQLLALSLRGRSGSDPRGPAPHPGKQLVVDYLIDEVLAQLPAAWQSFLLRTAIVSRVCGPLSDVLTSDAGSGIEPGAAMLARLERHNLFLTRLDDEGEWFRYHPLFADALRSRLTQTEPALAADLQTRAARWWLAQDAWAEALAHARASGRPTVWADTLEAASGPLLVNGQPGLLWDSFHALPSTEVARRPGLHLFAGWAALLTGRFDQVEAHLAQIEPAMQALTDEEKPALQGQMAAIRGYRLAALGDVAAALAMAQPAVEALPSHDPLMRAVIGMNLGAVYTMAGQIAPALQLLSDAEQVAQAIGNPWLALTAHGFLAQVWWEQGDLARAEAGFNRVLAVDKGSVNQRLNALFGLCGLAYERNRLDGAVEFLRQAQHIADQARLPEWQGLFALVRAKIAWAQGEERLARELLAETETLEQAIPVPTRDLVAAARWRLAGLMGAGDMNPALAAALANPSGFHGLQQKALYLAAGQALLTRARWTEARSFLEALLRIAEDTGRTLSTIEVLVMLATAVHGQGQPTSARELLGRAVALAAPLGPVRVFVDQGPAVRGLLLDLPPSVGRQRRLEAYPARGDTASPQALIEPLHARELEVLRLVAAGHSNGQIAAALTLAIGTVKKHLNNIFGKLGVDSRTRAVARARDLGLLDRDK